MDYRQTTEYLFGSYPMFQRIGQQAYNPGLDNITEFCSYLGNPQDSFPMIHIAGTNGKGSVAHSIAAVLQKAGWRTGLFTSPHLTDFRERIRIDGQMVTQSEVTRFVEEHRDAMERIGLSFFEVTAAMALSVFRDRKVDVAVMETGLGGRLDATNIITPMVSVITNISLEHTAILGPTVEAIAGEKAGIIKPGVPVVIGESDPSTAPVFTARAAECGSPITFADQRLSVVSSKQLDDGAEYTVRGLGEDDMKVTYELSGDYQRHNILTVLETLRVLSEVSSFKPSLEQTLSGLRRAATLTGLRGRWQILSRRPLVVCDCGHNPAGIASVVPQLSSQRFRRLTVVYGMASDKDWRTILPQLPHEADYIFTRASVDRAVDPDLLLSRASQFGLNGTVAQNVGQAYEMALDSAGSDDMVFIGGSCFIVADLLEYLSRNNQQDSSSAM